MHFSSGINRPPYEAADGFLQITSGCCPAAAIDYDGGLRNGQYVYDKVVLDN